MSKPKENLPYTSYNRKLLDNAKSLRKEMTRQERHLWYDFLRNYPIKFYRQRPIDRYIADFYCREAKLVVELDGSQHFSEEASHYDAARTQRFNALGLGVLRFANNDVDENFEGVCLTIDSYVMEALGKEPLSLLR